MSMELYVHRQFLTCFLRLCLHVQRVRVSPCLVGNSLRCPARLDQLQYFKYPTVCTQSFVEAKASRNFYRIYTA